MSLPAEKRSPGENRWGLFLQNRFAPNAELNLTVGISFSSRVILQIRPFSFCPFDFY